MEVRAARSTPYPLRELASPGMADLRAFEESLLQALRRIERHTVFADVLAEATDGEAVRVDRHSVTPTRAPRLRGAVFRAWGDGRWSEAATSSLTPEAIARAADALTRSLEPKGSGGSPPGTPSDLRQEWTSLPARPMHDVALSETISLAKDVLGWATEVPGIHECQVVVSWSDESRLYLNTAGARCYQVLPRVRAGLSPLAMENGRVEFDYLSEGGVGGRERLEFLTPERVQATSRDSVELLRARPAPAGTMEVLMDPSTSGTFAHESFGHGTEADQFVRDRSYLKPILGSMVGPNHLTIIDEGPFAGGWGTIYCDDEGSPGRRTVLVDRGRFVGGLHDRETAAVFKVPPTGNARRADFLSRLFVRMTNTYVEPGRWTKEELVREITHGVLMEHATSGIEDPQGGQMQLKVKKGRRIEHGRLTDLVSSMALSGRVLDVLKATRGVSRREDFDMAPGYCGKGHTDLLPVGSGGPFLLSTAIVGPA